MDLNEGLEAAFIACKHKVQKRLGESLQRPPLIAGICSPYGSDGQNVHKSGIERVFNNIQGGEDDSADHNVGTAGIIDELFNSIKIYDDDNVSIFSAIVKYILDLSLINPNICYVVVSHIASLPKPIPFIEMCPAMFCMTNVSLITDLVEQLMILYESDNRNILPVIGAMVELSLPNNLIPKLAYLVENAILIVEENDIPTLFRTILKSLTSSSSGEKTVLKLKKCFKNLCDESISLIVEAMWEILPSSLQASTLFLDQIIKEQKVLEGVGLLGPDLLPTLTDVSVLLILLTGTSFSGSNLKVKANNLFTIWLINDIFPFDQLQTILKLRRANDIWERMTPSIWTLCLWLIDNISKYTILTNKFLNYINTCKRGLSDLIGTLYSTVPSLDETIVNALLNRCYYNPQNHHPGVSRNHLSTVCVNDGLVLLAPLGSSHSNSVAESNSDSKTEVLEEKYCRIQANISAVILEHLAISHKNIGLVILASINNRLTPCTDGRILLPPPILLRKLLRCIVYCSGSSQQFEATILILTQKLLVTITQPNLDFLSIIASTQKLTSSSINLNKYSGMASRSQLFKSLRVQSLYSPISIGIILAHQLIYQRTNNIQTSLENSSLLHFQDYRALIEWVVRAFDTLQDDSIVYAIDFFVTCIGQCHVNIHKTATTFNATSEISSASSTSISGNNTINNLVRNTSNNLPVREYFISLHETINTLWNQFMQTHHIVLISGLSTLDYVDNTPSFVVDCSSSDLSFVPADCNDGPKNRPIIWCLARISRQLVEYNNKIIMSQDTSDVNLSLLLDSIFWLVQRASCLHYSLHPPKANSFTTGLQLSVTPELMDIKELLCGVNDDENSNMPRKSRFRSTPIRNSDVFEAVKNRVFIGKSLWSWTNSLLGGFNGSFIRPVGISTIISLRFSWERVLAAAILLGRLQSIRTSMTMTNDFATKSSILMDLLRILNQINCSRYMLRIAHSDEVRLLSNDVTSNGSKRRRNNNEKMLLHGKKSMKILPNQNPNINSPGIDYSNSADISPLIHKKVLEKLLNRLTNMIDDDSIHTSTLHLLQQSPLATITDGGFSLITTFIYRRIVFESPNKNGTEAEIGLPSLIYDAFVSMDESCCNNDATKTSTTITDKAILINKKFLTLTSTLVQYIENCRRGTPAMPFLDNVDANIVYALGSHLDLFGSSVLLLCIYMAIDSVLKLINKNNVQTDTDGIQDSEEVMMYCDELIMSQIPDTQSDLALSSRKKLLLLYNFMENQLLTLQDSVTSISCLKLLLTISKGTKLLKRCCVVSWTLLKSIFPDNIDIFSYNHGNIGMDPLWSTMASYVSTCLYYRQIQIELNNYGKSKNRCSVLFKSVFGIMENGLKATTKPDQFTIKVFLIIWWYHELPTHRLYGVASMIKEIFQRFIGVKFEPKIIVENQLLAVTATKKSARNHRVATDVLSNIKTKNQDNTPLTSSTNKIDKVPIYFAGMTNENVEIFFISALSVIPLLFFNAHADPSAILTDSGVASPYMTLIHTSLLYVITLRGVTQAITDGDRTKFLLRIILNCVKVCRASLDTIDYAALSAINWRNRSHAKLHADDDTTSVCSIDVGSIDYLAEALEWTLSCVQWTLRFTEVVKSQFLYSKACVIPKSLVRSIPQLQVSAEKLAGRLHKYAKIYNVMLEEPENTFSAWELQLNDSVSKYMSYNSSYLSTNELRDDCLNAVDIHAVSMEGDGLIDFNKSSASNGNDTNDNYEYNDFFSSRFVDDDDDDDVIDTTDELEHFSGWGMIIHDENI